MKLANVKYCTIRSLVTVSDLGTRITRQLNSCLYSPETLGFETNLANTLYLYIERLKLLKALRY